MRQALVILGSAADRACAALDGLTPLEIAHTPTLDAVARRGRVGGVTPVALDRPDRDEPEALADDAAALAALLGVSGGEDTNAITAAQARAAAMGVDLDRDAAVLTLDLVTTGDPASPGDDEDGVLLDAMPPGLTTGEARSLLHDLHEHWSVACPEIARSLHVHVDGPTLGSATAHVLTDVGGPIVEALRELHDESDRENPSPLPAAAHPLAVRGLRWQSHPPAGPAAEALTALMEESRSVCAQHEVNRSREAAGLPPISMAWLSGPAGRGPGRLARFQDVSEKRACMLTPCHVAAGVAKLAGIDRLPTPAFAGVLPGAAAASGDADDLEAAARDAASALDRYDLVIVHLPHALRPAAAGDPHGVSAALELLDASVIAPLLERLETFGDAEADETQPGWRLTAVCDRAVPSDIDAGSRSRRRPAEPVRVMPFAMAGPWVRGVVEHRFSEAAASRADLLIDPADGFIEYVLWSGLRRSWSKPRRAVTGG